MFCKVRKASFFVFEFRFFLYLNSISPFFSKEKESFFLSHNWNCIFCISYNHLHPFQRYTIRLFYPFSPYFEIICPNLSVFTFWCERASTLFFKKSFQQTPFSKKTTSLPDQSTGLKAAYGPPGKPPPTTRQSHLQVSFERWTNNALYLLMNESSSEFSHIIKSPFCFNGSYTFKHSPDEQFFKEQFLRSDFFFLVTPPQKNHHFKERGNLLQRRLYHLALNDFFASF